MAPAKPVTKWKRIVRKQLMLSNLPTSNQYAYSKYVDLIYKVALNNGLDDDAFRIERHALFSCLTGYMNSTQGFRKEKAYLRWEHDLIWYTAALLMDGTEGNLSPPFPGTSMECGACGLPVKINAQRSRYVCLHCNAQSTAGPNGIPVGVPVLSDIRRERERLHERLNGLMGGNKTDSTKRNLFYQKMAMLMNKPIHLTHIGLLLNYGDIQLWDLALDSLQTMIENKEWSIEEEKDRLFKKSSTGI